MWGLFKQFQNAIDTENKQPIKNIVRCLIEDFNDFSEWYKPFTDESVRETG